MGMSPGRAAADIPLGRFAGVDQSRAHRLGYLVQPLRGVQQAH